MSIEGRLTLPDSQTLHVPRRLSDVIELAFDQACIQRDLQVAESLVDILDILATRVHVAPSKDEHRKVTTNVVAHERLWRLRSEGNPLVGTTA